MNIKILLMLVLLIFSSFNGIEAQIKQKTHAESPKKRLTMEAIKKHTGRILEIGIRPQRLQNHISMQTYRFDAGRELQKLCRRRNDPSHCQR